MELRLAAGPVTELERLRRNVRVGTKNRSQGAAGDDEAFAVGLEDVLGCPDTLVSREGLQEAADKCGSSVQSNPPDVTLTFAETEIPCHLTTPIRVEARCRFGTAHHASLSPQSWKMMRNNR